MWVGEGYQAQIGRTYKRVHSARRRERWVTRYGRRAPRVLGLDGTLFQLAEKGGRHYFRRAMARLVSAETDAEGTCHITIGAHRHGGDTLQGSTESTAERGIFRR